jgi:hypothetical protein
MTTTNITLSFGKHASREAGMCTMEAVAFLAGEPHTDHPKCACPILAAYARILNDHMGTGPEGDTLRNKYLLPLTEKLIGTRSTSEGEIKRAFFFADKAVRLFAPLTLEAMGLTEEAKTLRALPKIVDRETAETILVTYVDTGHAPAADAPETDFARVTRVHVTARVRAAARAAAYAAARAAAYDTTRSPTVARATAYEAAVNAANAVALATKVATWEQATQVLAEACEIMADEHEKYGGRARKTVTRKPLCRAYEKPDQRPILAKLDP